MRYVYTGVGARETPPEYLHVMRELARWLRSSGWTLRSGHARGADQAFESGANGKAEVYLPWSGFESVAPIMGEPIFPPSVRALDIAEELHPAWHHLSYGGKLLQARNTHEVLGRYCQPEDASSFLVCWTRDGKGHGGTGQAIRVARKYRVPVFDLGIPGAIADVTQFAIVG
jgi:hypothetical protein